MQASVHDLMVQAAEGVEFETLARGRFPGHVRNTTYLAAKILGVKPQGKFHRTFAAVAAAAKKAGYGKHSYRFMQEGENEPRPHCCEEE